jgi:cyclase
VPAAVDHFRVEPLADGVFAAIARPRGQALCNAGIVDLGGSSLVFDAMLTPWAGAALAREAERRTHRPVGLLVNSHYHGDHMRGNASVGAEHVVSTARVRELIVERGPAHLASDFPEARRELERLRSGEISMQGVERDSYEGWFEAVLATPPDLEFRPPDLTFERELWVHGRTRSARIVTFGGGHSPSDVVVHLPDDRIVFCGDLVSAGFHPCLWDGDPDELVRILGELRALRADRTLPGHGPVSDGEAIETMARYVTALRSAAATARRLGTSRDDFARARPEPPFDRWSFTPLFEENARFLYDRAHPADA